MRVACLLFTMFVLLTPTLSIGSPPLNKSEQVALQNIESDLADALAENPSIKPQIIFADHVGAPSPHRWPLKNYKLTFTVVRGLSNWMTVSWGLIVSSGTPTDAALAIGAVAGGLAAGLQYYNDGVQRWTTGEGSTVGKWARTYAITLGFLSAAKITSAFFGLGVEPTLLLNVANLATTALASTIAQGPWGLAILEQKLIADDVAPLRERRHQFFADLKVLGISMVGAGVSIADLLNTSFSDEAMYALAAGGIGTYLWTLYKKHKHKKKCEKPLKLSGNLWKPCLLQHSFA